MAWCGSRRRSMFESERTFRLLSGDCLAIMPTLEAESIDSIVTDPPYGLSFMGKDWDHGVPGEAFWQEALRVAKPGAHLLAFGGTRTFHRLAVAIEDAGWEVRDTMMWVYGSGFPKSLDVSKAIDKAAGKNRPRIRGVRSGVVGPTFAQDAWSKEFKDSVLDATPITAAAAAAAGWGTALKPAWEPIIVARKPLIGTVAGNVLAHGTGAINVDGCRVGMNGETIARPSRFTGHLTNSHLEMRPWVLEGHKNGLPAKPEFTNSQGRFPANLIHDGSEEVLALFPTTASGGANGHRRANTGQTWDSDTTGLRNERITVGGRGSDSGSAARFFYCAKASKADRDEGCEGLKLAYEHSGPRGHGNNGDGTPRQKTLPRANVHPTVKPTALMRYLCRLVTPPGGVCLDPFTGSGSTGKAAVLEGMRFLGIELKAGYLKIAKARIAAACAKDRDLFAESVAVAAG